MNFICDDCKWANEVRSQEAKEHWHKECRGGTWCDCQHRSSK